MDGSLLYYRPWRGNFQSAMWSIWPIARVSLWIGLVVASFSDTNSSTTIQAKDLQPGDAVNSSDHIMLFKAWVTHGSVATFLEEHRIPTLYRNGST